MRPRRGAFHSSIAGSAARAVSALSSARGGAVALSLAVVITGCDAPAPASRTPSPHFARTGFAMGTVIEAKIVAADSTAAAVALDAAFAELARLEALTTSYSEESEVARLAAAEGWVEDVDPDVAALLRFSRQVAQRSSGAFDPTAGALVRLWGFGREPSVPSPEALAAARATIGWAQLEPLAMLADPGGDSGGSPRAWKLGRDGMELDLGGVAKGYGVDLAADLLASSGSGCLVNAGGDLAVRGTKRDGSGWLIGIQDPRDPQRIFLKVRVQGRQAVATSGDYQRTFEADGETYHHLLDPRTGYPARGVRSVTVIAPTCAAADAWATAAFVLGPELGLEALARERDVEGVLVTEDADGELVQHATAGFAAYVVP